MGYEDIKSGITKVLQDTKEKTIKVTEEVISCENDHPVVYICLLYTSPSPRDRG